VRNQFTVFDAVVDIVPGLKEHSDECKVNFSSVYSQYIWGPEPKFTAEYLTETLEGHDLLMKSLVVQAKREKMRDDYRGYLKLMAEFQAETGI